MRRIVKFKKFIFSAVIFAVIFQSGLIGVVFPIEKVFAALPESWANHIVISEVQISGATADDEFVELYNPTNNPITMNGWRLTKKTSTGTEQILVSSLNGTIPAYGFFLITPQSGYTGSTPANVQYSQTSNFIASNNTVLLYSDAGTTLVDKVGWGTAVDYETVVFGGNPSNYQSIERKPGASRPLDGNGIDTDNNNIDFDLRATSQPQNSSSTEVPDYDAPVTSANPPGGTYNSPQSVTLTAVDENPTTIYYTTDGSTPTTNSPVYSSPISISSDTTLKFFAVDSHGNEEAVKTENYVINLDTIKPTASIISATANNQQIVLQFSEAVKSSPASTITNYKLSRDGGMSFDNLTSENATVSYNSENYRATVTIIAGINFVVGENLVLAVSTNIEDLAGNPMEENLAPEFPGYYYTDAYTATSGEIPPSDKPVVSSVSYIEGIDENPEILTVTFSKNIATIGEISDYIVIYDADANFSTTEDQRNVAVLSVANAGNDNTVELTIPDQSQQTDAGGKFRVTVSENVKDSDGNGVDQTNGNNIGYSSTISSFDTHKPQIGSQPAVLFVEYKNQQKDILILTFSKKMKYVGSVEDYQVIYDADGNFNTTNDWRIVTVESVSLNSQNAKKIDLTIVDQSHFTDAGGKFRVTVSENVKDVAGNGVDQNKNIGYSSTVTSFDNYAPKIKSIILSPSKGVFVIGDSITITVIEADDEKGLTATGTFNKQKLNFVDNGDGSYTAIYKVGKNDGDAFEVEASVKLKDPAGHYDEANSSGNFINIHTQAPTNTSILINKGIKWTNSREVVLTLHAEDNFGPLMMQFSNDNENWSEWEDYATTKNYILPSGDGKKTVYVRFKDSAGYISETISDSIILDTTAPTENDLIIYKKPSKEDIFVKGDSIFLSGKTKPFYTIEIYVYSNPLVYRTKANANGYWEYKIPTDELKEGKHDIYIKIADLAGNISQMIWIASFKLLIKTNVVHATEVNKPPESPPSVQPTPIEQPIQKKSRWRLWISVIVGVIVLMVGGYLFFRIYHKEKNKQQKLF